MWITRAAIFPIAGMGHYDYGVMTYRYPMEASHDFILYPIMIGFIYFYDRMSRARESEIAAAQLRCELSEAKLENLRLQLHPHFLFNTLNAVSAVMYEDVRKADAMLARLSEFLRVILTTSDVQEITLDEELQIERMYVDVMKGTARKRAPTERRRRSRCASGESAGADSAADHRELHPPWNAAERSRV